VLANERGVAPRVLTGAGRRRDEINVIGVAARADPVGLLTIGGAALEPAGGVIGELEGLGGPAVFGVQVDHHVSACLLIMYLECTPNGPLVKL
jgi:hypothetical protein